MTAGHTPKHPSRRQRRNLERPRLEVHTGGLPAISPEIPNSPEIPKPPKCLLKVTRDRWTVYWLSEVARVAGDVDMPIVERLHRRYDERERAYREVRKDGRLTVGSQGQLVLHPLLRYIDACEQEIRQLEDRLGLSPHARLRMGATLAGAKRSLQDRNTSLNIEDQEDPR